MAAIQIRLDTEQLTADLALLAQAAEGSERLRQLGFGLFDDPAQFRCVQIESPLAGAAGQAAFRLELADRLAQLVAAVRAGDVDGLRVDG